MPGRTICAIAALVAALLAGFVSGPARAAGDGPIVVELYTSQGCSTCPPADAFLGELAGREDVIALSFHVDYWDYIGWKDQFALPGNTDRQRRYSRRFHTGYVYTPQMVVDGRGHHSGADRAAVEELIDGARAATDARLNVRIVENADGTMSAEIPALPGAPEAEVWMVLYDRSHTTEISRGENAGRTLTYFNIVRDMRHLADYDGQAMTVSLEAPTGAAAAGRDGCVVVVQEDGQGPVLGAAGMAFAVR